MRKKLYYFYDGLSAGVAITTALRLNEFKKYFDVAYVVPFHFSADHYSWSVIPYLNEHGISILSCSENQIDLTDISNTRKVFSEFLEFNVPDILIIPGIKSVCSLFAEEARRLHSPLICAEMRLHALILAYSDTVEYLNNVADIIVPNSLACAEVLEEAFPHKKVFPVVNGISEESVQIETIENPLAGYLSQDDISIVSVGHTHYQKNHFLLLKALKDLHLQTAKFKCFIVGSDDIGVALLLKDIVKDYGLEKNVVFLGLRNDVNAILKYADIFCITSFFEGMPKSLLEAMNYKCAVVGVDAPGISEVIDDGLDGLKVTIDDYKHLSSNIWKLMHNSALREKLGRNARKKILNSYSIEKIIKCYADKLLAEVLSAAICHREDKDYSNTISSTIFPVLEFNKLLDEILDSYFIDKEKYQNLIQCAYNNYVIAYIFYGHDLVFIEKFIKVFELIKEYIKDQPNEILRCEKIFKYLYAAVENIPVVKRFYLFHSIAGCFERIEKFDFALLFFDKADLLGLKDINLKISICFHKANILYKKKDYTEAAFILEKLLLIIPTHKAAKLLMENINKEVL